MPNQQIFCNSPWFELHIYWDGTLAFCCHANPAVPYPEVDKPHYNIKNMSIAEWYRSAPMQEARQRLLSNESWDHCRKCYQEESLSGTSRRHRSNQKSVIFTKENFQESFEQSPSYSKFTDSNYQGMPIDLHIDLGNYCNLACKMCNPYASSRIASQHKTWMMLDTVLQDWTQDEPTWNRFLQELLTIPKLKNIHFMGGETIIQPRFEECIDFLIANNRTDISISFVTNGTVYNDRLIQKLKLFARVGLEVSIETLTETNSYIRQGTDTKQVLKHIEQYYSECNGTTITLTLRPAPQLLSARDYWQLIEFAITHKLMIKSIVCSDPRFLSVDVLPWTIRQTYLSAYTALLDKYHLNDDLDKDFNESNPDNYRIIAKNHIMQMISLLELPDPENQNVLLTQLCQHIQSWDRVYGYDAKLIYPELARLLEWQGYAL